MILGLVEDDRPIRLPDLLQRAGQVRNRAPAGGRWIQHGHQELAGGQLVDERPGLVQSDLAGRGDGLRELRQRIDGGRPLQQRLQSRVVVDGHQVIVRMALDPPGLDVADPIRRPVGGVVHLIAQAGGDGRLAGELAAQLQQPAAVEAHMFAAVGAGGQLKVGCRPADADGDPGEQPEGGGARGHARQVASDRVFDLLRPGDVLLLGPDRQALHQRGRGDEQRLLHLGSGDDVAQPPARGGQGIACFRRRRPSGQIVEWEQRRSQQEEPAGWKEAMECAFRSGQQQDAVPALIAGDGAAEQGQAEAGGAGDQHPSVWLDHGQGQGSTPPSPGGHRQALFAAQLPQPVQDLRQPTRAVARAASFTLVCARPRPANAEASCRAQWQRSSRPSCWPARSSTSDTPGSP